MGCEKNSQLQRLGALLLLSMTVASASLHLERAEPGSRGVACNQAVGHQSDMAEPASSTRHLLAGARMPLIAPGTRLGGWHQASKRDPLGINARGFHEDVFNRDYGTFHPMRRRRSSGMSPESGEDEQTTSTAASSETKMIATKRRPEMDQAGFYGDTFTNGLGEFWPLKKRWNAAYKQNAANDAWRKWYKRKPEMDSSGFFGDTFSNGFGDFWTMKKKSGSDVTKRRPEMDSAGFYGDTFSNGFGDFWTVKKKFEKRRPEMDSAGFYGDTFSNGFGDFWTVKKRSTQGVAPVSFSSAAGVEEATMGGGGGLSNQRDLQGSAPLQQS